ncbi:PfkB family carbohydrate kinase [Desulfurispirillum indicum]|uniref:PfkB family carbohydrate kinase n=1 Tax=Desulfurispirillum indicum TaxID=936456 RepID=UPI001CFC0F89|nr:PfkB family carbohydrate kinase [Desulfurispirillum indicum]UCZ56440.1 PfkB family carbohydrate kinase [Desulfurispirillum indicum]
MHTLSCDTVVFGEVLFDVFPGGRAALGGAPFNVAWHLRGLGAEPLFVSRVGRDPYGAQIMQAMQRQKMLTEALQQDDHLPTGTVDVKLREGIPSYTIASPCAYDAIEPPPVFSPAPHALLYHGTLALRHSRSRQSLLQLQQTSSLPSFIDLNLRSPHYDAATVRACLEQATWLKLNTEELLEVTRLLGMTSLITGFDDAGELFRAFPLQGIVLTCGGEGAFVLLRCGERHFCPAVPVSHMEDTVGAGDAFSAVAMLGIMRQWSMETLLHRAATFAASICAVQGALPADHRLYRQTLQQWNGA